METQKKTNYMQEKIGFREIFQFIANLAIIYIAYQLFMFREGMEQAIEAVKPILK